MYVFLTLISENDYDFWKGCKCCYKIVEFQLINFRRENGQVPLKLVKIKLLSPKPLKVLDFSRLFMLFLSASVHLNNIYAVSGLVIHKHSAAPKNIIVLVVTSTTALTYMKIVILLLLNILIANWIKSNSAPMDHTKDTKIFIAVENLPFAKIA